MTPGLLELHGIVPALRTRRIGPRFEVHAVAGIDHGGPQVVHLVPLLRVDGVQVVEVPS